MSEQKSKPNFSKKQYDMLRRCSEKENMAEWNEWRENNPDEIILLQRANLKGAYLEGAKLQGATLWEAKLQRANLRETYLQKAKLMRAHLQGAEFGGAKLQGADFSRAIVDGSTLIWRCEVDRETKFEGVVLDATRIYPKTKQLLEYNVRWMNWEDWYKWKDWFKDVPKEERNKLSQFFLRNTIGWFWAISDYGKSTGRIIGYFFCLALFFAAIYRLWPDCVIVNCKIGGLRSFLHTVYFSVVTMTTLGFGDIAANPDSALGQLLLMLQVILGYVLLGALVTRFAILFTAGGPTGKFSKSDEKKAR